MFPGGKEGIEDAIEDPAAHADTRVAHGDLDVVAGPDTQDCRSIIGAKWPGLNRKNPSPFTHRVHRIGA